MRVVVIGPMTANPTLNVSLNKVDQQNASTFNGQKILLNAKVDRSHMPFYALVAGSVLTSLPRGELPSTSIALATKWDEVRQYLS